MIADLLASAHEPNPAKMASIVEPILLPNVIAQAVSHVIIPLNAIVITMALKAEDECIKAVITIPTKTAIKIEKNPQLCILERNVKFSASKVNTSESPLRPRKSNPKPMIASPIFLDLESFIKVKKKPRPKIGSANVEILKLNPNKETIHAVIVVPIFAPKITPTDCVSVKRPALIKEITMTVVAPEDWIIMVISNPVIKPMKGFPVSFASAR